MKRIDTALLIAAVAALGGSPVEAQTNDRFFRSWRWSQDQGAPRAMGLAGAYVAVADDAAAAAFNPAGMTTLRGSEVAGAALHRAGGPVGLDALAARTDLGFAGGAAVLSSKWAVGGYIARPRAVELSLSPEPLADGLADVGSLRATVTEWGGSAAWHPVPGLHVGMRVSASHLELEGAYTRGPVDGPAQLRVGTASGDTRITGSLGILATPTRSLRLGVLVTPGASWLVERTALSPELGLVLDGGSEYEVRSPGTVLAGLSLQVSPKLMLSAQVDYVRYSELQSTLGIRRGGFELIDYAAEDAWEPRLGVETSWPIGSVALQIRGGAHREAAGGLRFDGEEPAEALAFSGGEARWRGASGLSIVGRRWATHFAYRFGAEPHAFTGGLSLSF